MLHQLPDDGLLRIDEVRVGVEGCSPHIGASHFVDDDRMDFAAPIDGHGERWQGKLKGTDKHYKRLQQPTPERSGPC